MNNILMTMQSTPGNQNEPRRLEKIRTLALKDGWSSYDTLPPIQHQEVDELFWLLRQLKHVSHVKGAAGLSWALSILEIGSFAGDTLQFLAMALGRATKVCSIDISDEAGLSKRMAELRAHGYEADCLIADSASANAIQWAREQALSGLDRYPFDFVFIDGCHDYETVKMDWMNYRDMAPLIGFHDIAFPGLGPHKLWQEIKQDYWTMERVVVPNYMGIGMVKC